MMLLTLPFLDKTGFDTGEIIGYTSMVLAFLMVYFGVRSPDRKKCTLPHQHPTSEVL